MAIFKFNQELNNGRPSSLVFKIQIFMSLMVFSVCPNVVLPNFIVIA